MDKDEIKDRMLGIKPTNGNIGCRCNWLSYEIITLPIRSKPDKNDVAIGLDYNAEFLGDILNSLYDDYGYAHDIDEDGLNCILKCLSKKI